MPLEILRNDITKMKVDAIVNAANSRLKKGGGVCGAIFAAAGPDALQRECDQIGYCAVGSAVLTGGGKLAAKYIIHTVGPIWQGGTHNERDLLFSSYTNSLKLALKHKIRSIAFPLISSGIYGYPKDKAIQVAIAAIGAFLLEHDMMVYLLVYDRAAYKLSDRLFTSIKAYIDDNYVTDHTPLGPQRNAEVIRQLSDTAVYEGLGPDAPLADKAPAAPRDLEDLVGRVDESFTEMLFRLIAESGKTDPQVYKRANLDRRLFSKIRSNPYYQPSKNTALALAIALELNLDQTADLLRRAGFALSPSSRFDLVVRYFIDAGNYNIFEINEALFAFDENLLGA